MGFSCPSGGDIYYNNTFIINRFLKKIIWNKGKIEEIYFPAAKTSKWPIFCCQFHKKRKRGLEIKNQTLI